MRLCLFSNGRRVDGRGCTECRELQGIGSKSSRSEQSALGSKRQTSQGPDNGQVPKRPATRRGYF